MADRFTQFDYLLNALEAAAQTDAPAEHGYGEKRRKLYQHVRELERKAAAYDAAAGAALPAVPAEVPAGQVVAWMWQHEETGRIGFIDQWQIENGWEAANPRLRPIRPMVFAALFQPKPSEGSK